MASQDGFLAIIQLQLKCSEFSIEIQSDFESEGYLAHKNIILHLAHNGLMQRS